MPTSPIYNGAMPMIGFGTWQLSGVECQRAVETALECGYRHIDTADMYGNHAAVAAAMKRSGLPREDIFLTSKVWRDDLRMRPLQEACHRIIRELKTDYLNLFLIHWPNNAIRIDESLDAARIMQSIGMIDNFGVSNFTARRLEEALSYNVLPISVNQVEYHPYLNQKDLQAFCQTKGVAVTGYAPLARGKVLADPLIGEIAGRYGKTSTQVALRWLLQRGISVIPKATSRAHITANIDILDFELSPEDFAAIDAIDRWERIVNMAWADFDK